jgi:hypothetical protein
MSEKEVEKYNNTIRNLFLKKYKKGDKEISFTREELEEEANNAGGVSNLGDILYTYRFRRELPKEILDLNNLFVIYFMIKRKNRSINIIILIFHLWLHLPIYRLFSC